MQCKGQVNGDDAKPERHLFSFELSDTDSSKIGMKRFEDGSEQSVTSICRFGNYIYLSDPVHLNIKRISAIDGVLTISAKLENVGEPSDMLIVDSVLYVVSTRGFLVILDLDLKVRKSVKFPIQVCDDMRFMNIGNERYVFCPGDIDQDNVTYLITIQALRIEPDLSFTQALVNAGKGYGAYLNYVQGYELSESGHCLKQGSLVRCIDRPYPTGRRFPSSRLVSLTANSLATFDVVEGKCFVYSYDWFQR